MGKLIVASKGQLEGNAERFDGHDRNRAHEGADAEVDEWVFLSIDGRYLVDHEHGKRCHGDRVYQEAWANVSIQNCLEEVVANLPYQVVERMREWSRWSQCPRLAAHGEQ